MTRSPSIRRPKLAHVAMAAGVSLGTASDALRGKGRMSEDTRRRVMSAAEQMGYRPNANARILALGHSQIVALVAHGPGTSAAPRIYWPRLQATFTERLLEQGMVACTMTLTDLHKLDGLPFDLIVFAGLDSSDSLPEQIRSDYRVFEIDLVGEGRIARSLRDQLAGACRAALDHLVESGVRRPGLVFAGDTGAAARLLYESWCAERGVMASLTDAADPTGRSEALIAAAGDGVDGFFSVLAEGRWLGDVLAALDATTEPRPVIALGPVPDRGAVPVGFASLVPDGQNLGEQLADAAIAVLRGSRPPDISLEFLLDGAPFPAAGLNILAE